MKVQIMHKNKAQKSFVQIEAKAPPLSTLRFPFPSVLTLSYDDA